MPPCSRHQLCARLPRIPWPRGRRDMERAGWTGSLVASTGASSPPPLPFLPAGLQSTTHPIGERHGGTLVNVADAEKIVQGGLRNVSRHTWERFLWHASLVRVLRHREEGDEIRHLDAQLSQNVLQRNGGVGIFTGLHAASWEVSSLSDPYLLPLFTASLDHLSIYVQSSYDTLNGEPTGETKQQPPAYSAQICQTLRRVSPELTSITLNAVVDEAVSRELLNFPRLEEIRRMEFTSQAAFRDLVSKPGLAFLELVCKGATPISRLSNFLSRKIPTSDTVELSLSGSCSHLTPLFSQFRAPALRKVTLVLSSGARHLWHGATWKPQHTAEYGACMHALAATVPDLTDLSLDIVAGRMSLQHLFTPLFSLPSIRRFSYGSAHGCGVHTGTDADFVAVANAWPQLETLRFEQERMFWKIGNAVPSLAILSFFSRCSPRLIELQLPPLVVPETPNGVVDAVQPLNLDAVHLLETLKVKLSATDLVDEDGLEFWEAYLRRLFPCLASDGHLLHRELADEESQVVCGHGDVERRSQRDRRPRCRSLGVDRSR